MKLPDKLPFPEQLEYPMFVGRGHDPADQIALF